MMKRWMALIVCTALTVSLAACGGGESGGTATKTSEANAKPLEIVATNYSFDQQEYRVKAGDPIEFSLNNKEGRHAYEIKELGINIQANKPQQYTIETPGEYEIACSIFCGSGHEDMKSTLIVEE